MLLHTFKALGAGVAFLIWQQWKTAGQFTLRSKQQQADSLIIKRNSKKYVRHTAVDTSLPGAWTILLNFWLSGLYSENGNVRPGKRSRKTAIGAVLGAGLIVDTYRDGIRPVQPKKKSPELLPGIHYLSWNFCRKCALYTDISRALLYVRQRQWKLTAFYITADNVKTLGTA